MPGGTIYMVDDMTNIAATGVPQAMPRSSKTILGFKAWHALEETKAKSSLQRYQAKQALFQIDRITRKIKSSPNSKSRDLNLAIQNKILAMLVVRLIKSRK